MPLAAGVRLGPYEIIAPLGAGGMGEVYRTRDTKLKREVALKVLPKAFAQDADRLARFQREAELLATLNHQNIAAVYGLETSGGLTAIVLELVEGETLAERIEGLRAEGKGLPLDEALPIVRQIADALEAAHEQGVIHRDLKPANIKVRADGTVKVLDFGLAKALEGPGGAGRAGGPGGDDLANSPTITSPAMTRAGVILGTAAYMSPEQAKGKAVDKRTDIWAFGCVLYELLTGRRAFAGDDVTDLVVAVMTKEPDWTRLPAATPPRIVELLKRCLKKGPRERLHDIADARITIDEATTEPAARERQVIPVVASWRWLVTGFTAVLIIGVLIGWLATRPPSQAPAVTNLQMSVQPADQLNGSRSSVRPSQTAFAWSPDGRRIVFSASVTRSVTQTRGAGASQTVTSVQLYLRGLEQSEAKPIPGTEDGVSPFFSPDGQWIGYFAQSQIKKVPVGGGPPVVICEVPRVPTGFALFGASWAEDGTIFFSDRGDGISKVPSGGGSPTVVTTGNVAKGERHLLPHSLPGGKAVMFTALTSFEWDKAQIVLHSLETGERRVLIQGGADARYVQTGHLLYMKIGTLMAVPFDARTLQVVGDPVALLDSVMQAVNHPNTGDETGAGQFTVSNSETLAYVTGGVHPILAGALVWVDRKGAAQPLPSVPVGGVRRLLSPRFSTDEGRVALSVQERSNPSMDLWVYDTLRGAPTRLTTSGSNWAPVWSPDGRRLAFASTESGPFNLHIVNADGSGQTERLTTSEFSQAPSSWTAQGNLIAFVEFHPPKRQIWVQPLDGDRKPRLFLESGFSLEYPEFSPDGRWLAYVSAESTPAAVYVQPYPGPGAKHRISTEGGSEPIWAANGRELLYRSDQKFFSVPITSLDPFRAEAPRLLFEAKPNEYATTQMVRDWDVSRDGQRFLLTRPEESKDKPVTQIQVVLNWSEELKRRVPAK